MKYTTNYNLYKPDYDDIIDVDFLNKNMDVLDNQIKKAGDIDLSRYALKKDYLPLVGGAMKGNIQLPELIGLMFGAKSNLNFSNSGGNETLNINADKLNCNIAGKPFTIVGNSITYDGNDLIIASKGTNFVKLSNGLTFQWGFIEKPDKATWVNAVTLPTPMNTNNYVVVCSRDSLNDADITTYPDRFGDYAVSSAHTVTSFMLSLYQVNMRSGYSWLAIGGI